MDDEALIEQVVSAHRERTPHGEVRDSPAFHDLDPSQREQAFRLTELQRSLEAAQDLEGLSSTARLVLKRIADH